MRIASIDIGTNSVLLLIADVDEEGNINPLLEEQRYPRLGRDVDRNKIIHVSAFDRVAWVVNEYKNMAKQFRADKIIACATSAVRDASNKNEFLSFLATDTGVEVDMLTGEEEAMLTYRGALSGLSRKVKNPLIIDVGGGSTEVCFSSLAKENAPQERIVHFSLSLGCVRLTERFLRHDPPEPAEVAAATEIILEQFQPMKLYDLSNHVLVGAGGTATALACIDQNLREFEASKVSGHTMDKEQVACWSEKLSKMSHKQILSLSPILEGREDILTAGVMIIYEVMKGFDFERIQISERGLRYGLLIHAGPRAEW